MHPFAVFSYAIAINAAIAGSLPLYMLSICNSRITRKDSRFLPWNDLQCACTPYVSFARKQYFSCALDIMMGWRSESKRKRIRSMKKASSPSCSWQWKLVILILTSCPQLDDAPLTNSHNILQAASKMSLSWRPFCHFCWVLSLSTSAKLVGSRRSTQETQRREATNTIPHHTKVLTEEFTFHMRFTGIRTFFVVVSLTFPRWASPRR